MMNVLVYEYCDGTRTSKDSVHDLWSECELTNKVPKDSMSTENSVKMICMQFNVANMLLQGISKH